MKENKKTKKYFHFVVFLNQFLLIIWSIFLSSHQYRHLMLTLTIKFFFLN